MKDCCPTTSHTHCYPQTYCFVVSQLFSVIRHAGRFKLGSKPTQLYVTLSILPLSPQTTYVSSGIIRHYVFAFVCLHSALPDTRVLNSLEELGITWVAAVNSFAWVLKPGGREHIYIYIYIYIWNLYRRVVELFNL